MNHSRKMIVLVAAIVPLLAVLSYRAAAEGPLVSEVGNLHNLASVARQRYGTNIIPNTNPYRAADTNQAGRQVCIFCHTPHNAYIENGAPLWNRLPSTQVFQRYSSSTLQIRSIGAAAYGAGVQPDGASKLCLSCHDGVSSLGNLLSGTIQMVGLGPDGRGGDKIVGRAAFTGNKMKIGHHPVSFRYDPSIAASINASGKTGYQYPTTPAEVKLDKSSKMQCTTCHDAHQNKSDDTACYDSTGTSVITCGFQNMSSRKVAPFWVYHGNSNTAAKDHDDVCTACHPLTGTGMLSSPNPGGNPPNAFPTP